MPADQPTNLKTLFAAVESRDFNTFRKHFTPGTDPNATYPNTDTSLLDAAFSRSAYDIAAALIDAGADLPKNLNLTLAVFTRRPDIVQRYIDAGADVNPRTVGGWTPLGVAVNPPRSMPPENAHALLEIIPILLHAGADMHEKSTFGTVLERARESNPQAYTLLKNFTPPVTTISSAAPKPIQQLQSRLNARPVPLPGTPGAFTFHVPAKLKINLQKLQTEFITHDYFLFATDADTTKLTLLPRADKFKAIAHMSTNGINHGLTTDDLIAWLRQLESTHPFLLLAIGFDFLSGKFLTPVPDPADLANQMAQICPDIIDDHGTIPKLAAHLKKSRTFHLWWD